MRQLENKMTKLCSIFITLTFPYAFLEILHTIIKNMRKIANYVTSLKR